MYVYEVCHISKHVSRHTCCFLVCLSVLVLYRIARTRYIVCLEVVGPFKCYIMQWGVEGVNFSGKSVTKV